jgi:phosphoglycerate dehydrogenase-like enzyme
MEYVGLADEAVELARQADVVVNTAPLTDATRGMFKDSLVSHNRLLSVKADVRELDRN